MYGCKGDFHVCTERTVIILGNFTKECTVGVRLHSLEFCEDSKSLRAEYIVKMTRVNHNWTHLFYRFFFSEHNKVWDICSTIGWGILVFTSYFRLATVCDAEGCSSLHVLTSGHHTGNGGRNGGKLVLCRSILVQGEGQAATHLVRPTRGKGRWLLQEVAAAGWWCATQRINTNTPSHWDVNDPWCLRCSTCMVVPVLWILFLYMCMSISAQCGVRCMYCFQEEMVSLLHVWSADNTLESGREG